MTAGLRTLCAFLVAVVLGAGHVYAQAGATAQITGTVRDSSGGVLPGVDVTATQTQTNFSRSAITDENGIYTLPNLPVGPYRIQATLSGFRTYVQTGVALTVTACFTRAGGGAFSSEIWPSRNSCSCFGAVV